MMSDDFAQISRIINDRYSCRGYLETEVSEHDIREIIATASRAPTWCNAQPWKVIVTRGAETRAFADVLTRTAETSQMEPDFAWPIQYTGEYQDRRRVCGYQLYEAVGVARDDKVRRAEQMMQNFRFFGAPHVAIITSDADLGPYGAMDCGGFIALFSLVARAKGIASVVQASVTGYAPAIRKHFRIPADRLIQTAISFGYEDKDHPANSFRTDRAASEDVVTFVG